ncbi:GNAT family N-acetyltransferase [Pararhizobium mangrovi]|uniref:GNAT family N-acetyltransferase n=1 Tax=Pararhizobium mangrovi TaxID=2590452 RepID=A0A506TZA4_9HYPH|nr:GNAT family N-acetyltransferase [Pararhizobium mangrovi]TPW26055.1 GNAT family N-acetyltransferase [Pararhizobium mangrovi]
MTETPRFAEHEGSRTHPIHAARPEPVPGTPQTERALPLETPGRTLSIYPARAGYDLQRELDFLTNRAIEPNVFFTGRFLAPAMPRLEDRQIRLLMVRDEDERRSRLRFVMPFSIDRRPAIGLPILRAWANPFAPNGTPIVDREDAAGTLDDLFGGLADAQAGFPGVMVLPQLDLDGPFVRTLRAIALSRGLALAEVQRHSRAVLESTLDGETYLRERLSKHRRNELNRQQRRLEGTGRLTYDVARQPDAVARRLEDFLFLEADGWKGRQRTALINDRYRAAFTREAIANLAEIDAVRIHALDLDGRMIAGMVVFVMGGTAYTWKTAYDEAQGKDSPGALLMRRLTEWQLEDANILRTDSCALPDHPVMDRFWAERATIGTLVVGLTPENDRDVRQVATRYHLYENTRSIARRLRDKVRTIARLQR